MDYHKIHDYFQDKQAEMLEAIGLLVCEETPTEAKERLDRFAASYAKRLEAVGADVELLPNESSGVHIRASLHGPMTDIALKPALVLCHYDTVWPVGSLETHPFRVEAGKAYGPGIFDMQSSLVLCEYAMRAIRDLALDIPRPLTFLITSDEEVGSLTSRPLIEEEALRSAYVLVLESPLKGGVIKTARKGVGRFTVQITGKAVHSGVEPEKGISAVQELAHQILHLHALTDYEKGSTVNVGVAQGGTRTNVVAAEATAEIDLRVWTQAEAARMESAILGLQPVTPGAQVRVIGDMNRPPLERHVTLALFQHAHRIGHALGVDLQEGSTGGGSDGNLTGALGVPTLDGLGVPGDGAHADYEHIEVDRIPLSGALLTGLLLDVADVGA